MKAFNLFKMIKKYILLDRILYCLDKLSEEADPKEIDTINIPVQTLSENLKKRHKYYDTPNFGVELTMALTKLVDEGYIDRFREHIPVRVRITINGKIFIGKWGYLFQKAQYISTFIAKVSFSVATIAISYYALKLSQSQSDVVSGINEDLQQLQVQMQQAQERLKKVESLQPLQKFPTSTLNIIDTPYNDTIKAKAK